jgi:hypothetical protein
MKAIVLLVSVGAFMGYSLAAYSKPLSADQPMALAQNTVAHTAS